MNASRKQLFICGAFGGIGRATIEKLLLKDWHIFAADINPDILIHYADHPRVTPLIIDVRDEASIKDAFAFVEERTDGLDGLIVMSGILSVGSVVELSLDELKRLLNINLYGVYEINKTFLPMLINRKGRILTMSSEIGTQTAAPFNGLYAISKHAIEAYSDSLRRELAFIGLKVIKIQPGPFKTTMTKNAEKQFIEAEAKSVHFKKNLKKGIPYLPKVYKNAKDPSIVANVIVKALESNKPRIAYAVKPDLPRRILDILPVRWADWIIRKTLS